MAFDRRGTIGLMGGFFHSIEHPRAARALETAGRVADRSTAGFLAPRKKPAPYLDEPTAAQRREGLRRVKALFGGEVPRVPADGFAPRP